MVSSSNIKFKNFLKKAISPTNFVGLIALIVWAISNLQRPTEFKREGYFLAPPKEIVRFAFGYNEPMADIFWIRAIQDFDYCDQKIDKTNCRGNSWLYKIIDVTTELSPQFRVPHSMGAIALSVIISDIPGASKIFDKATVRFPKDWTILGRAAYHAMYEEDDRSKAARLLKQAAENGGPYWYYALAGRRRKPRPCGVLKAAWASCPSNVMHSEIQIDAKTRYS